MVGAFSPACAMTQQELVASLRPCVIRKSETSNPPQTSSGRRSDGVGTNETKRQTGKSKSCVKEREARFCGPVSNGSRNVRFDPLRNARFYVCHGFSSKGLVSYRHPKGTSWRCMVRLSRSDFSFSTVAHRLDRAAAPPDAPAERAMT
jgi:hypothetical protein